MLVPSLSNPLAVPSQSPLQFSAQSLMLQMRALHQPNKAGWWRDYFDLTTAFTDTAGTTAISAVDQTYALHLDKSRGMVLGPELVTNGDFSNGSTGWTLVGDTTVSGGKLYILTAGATQSILTQGRWYKVTFTVTIRSGTFKVQAGSSNVSPAVFVASSSGTYTAYIMCDTASALFYAYRNGNGDMDVDNISVKQISGIHATQATGTARPQYFNRYNRLSYTEDFSNAAWAKSRATVDGYTTAPDGTSTAQLVTFSAQFAQIFQDTLFASNGEAVRNKIWIKRVSGNTSLRIRGRSASAYTATITVTDDWAEYAADFVHDGTNAVGLSIQDGNASGWGQIAVWHPECIRAINTTLPYQRVGNSPYALASRTSDYDTDPTKFPYYAEFDTVDDKLSLTAPAITGQIAIATTRGLWIDDITVAAGTFDNGPKTYTGGPAGLVAALGAQYIGEIVREGTFTQAEIDLMLAVYAPKGCPGLITLGSDIIDLTPDTINAGWVNNGDGSFTATAATGYLIWTAGLVSGQPYLTSFRLVSRVAGNIGEIGTIANQSVVGTYRGIQAVDTDGCRIFANGFTGVIDSISHTRIIFP